VPRFLFLNVWPSNCTVGAMPSLTSAHFAEPHFACLDMVWIDCAVAPGRPASEYAVLLDIWEHGATVQTSFPVSAGTSVEITVGKRQVAAKVTSCDADQSFGFLLELRIGLAEAWFPRAYKPAWQSSEPTALTAAPFVC